MGQLNIGDWQAILKDIAEQKRHRLTGSEYKQLVTLIDAQPKDMNNLQETRKLVAQLAKHQGPDAPPPFRDQSHNRAFQVEAKPAAPAPGDIDSGVGVKRQLQLSPERQAENGNNLKATPGLKLT